MVLVKIGLERDGTTGQDRICLHRGMGVLHHHVGLIQVTVNQPLQVVGGKLHILQDVVQAENRILHDLGGTENGLLTDITPGYDEKIP